MSNTRIVLNRQSDLILTNALITNPSGLTQSDINGLVPSINQINQNIDSTVDKLKAEANDRREADASLEDLLEAKVSTEKGRIDAILSGSTVDLDQFAEVVTFVQGIDLENDQALLGAITSIESKHDAEVSAEISSRVSADAFLNDYFEEELNDMSQAVWIETSTRATADISLEQADISLEQAMTEYVDVSMKKEIKARTEGDTSLETRLSVEESRAENAEASIAQVLSTEVSSIISNTDLTAIDSFAEVVSEVSAEISSRVSADYSIEELTSILVSNLQDAVEAEESSRVSADYSIEELTSILVSNLQDAVEAEESSRISGDASLGDEINHLGGKTAAADTSLEELIGSEIKTEIAARAAADSSLEAKVSTEKGRIDAILSGSTVDLDQFSEVVAFVQGIDLENDQALLGAVVSIESKHDAEVSTEISSRVSADTSLGEYVDSSMKKADSERAAADTSLEELIGSEMKAEIEARTKGDSDLQTVIDAEVSTRESIEAVIKAGVNAALVEIKSMIMATTADGSFQVLTTESGDGIATTFGVSMNGQGAIYLNGLLQHDGSDYSTNSYVDEKGNPVVEFIFNEAPANGSQIAIYGQPGPVADSNWYGDITPLV
jgi:hypothetical protein